MAYSQHTLPGLTLAGALTHDGSDADHEAGDWLRGRLEEGWRLGSIGIRDRRTTSPSLSVILIVWRGHVGSLSTQEWRWDSPRSPLLNYLHHRSTEGWVLLPARYLPPTPTSTLTAPDVLS